jgi:hypothetical protein
MSRAPFVIRHSDFFPHSSFVIRHLLTIAIVLFTQSCGQPLLDLETSPDTSFFSATTMRIHPIFSQVKDWTGDGKPDGLEVLIEFQDQFGDPAKAAGTLMFEVYDYRIANPDPRGQRLANPWVGSIATLEDQRSRWNRTSRTYTFQLAFPQVDKSKSYVLTAMFRSTTGGRFFDRIVLEGEEELAPTTQPTTRPSLFR